MPSIRPFAVTVLLLLSLAACTSGPSLPPLATATAVPVVASSTPTPPPSPPTTPTPQSGLRIIDAGTASDSDTVTVQVEEGERGLLVVTAADQPGQLVGIDKVTDPTGDVRYLADLARERVVVDDLDHRVLADADAVGLFITGGDDAPLVAGPWQVRVATNGDRVGVRAAATRGATTDRRLVDLVVWATAPGIDPAQGDRWRDSMEATLAPHNLGVDTLEIVAAGDRGALHRAIGVDGLAGDAHEACQAAVTATDADPGTAVVVLAERIGEGALTAYRAPDGNISGFAVSTPGTSVLGPASHACAVVSAGAEVQDLGLVILHEVLHLAGLTRHTTEPDGVEFDAFPDTPECPLAGADADGDGRVAADECADAGGDNLMFWADGGTALTPLQAARVRWHPLFRAGS